MFRAGEILVAHYNPLKPRDQAQDDVSGKVGGHVTSFRAGDVHRMALESPVDQFWMGGIVDKYFSVAWNPLLGSLDESRSGIIFGLHLSHFPLLLSAVWCW